MLETVAQTPGSWASPVELQYIPQLGVRSERTGREPELSGVRQQLIPLVIHVDDDPGTLQLMQIILDRLGNYRVLSFLHSDPALEACHDSHPALLITDIMRPDDIDGVALCRRIRQDPQLHNLPLLIHSAKAIYELNGPLQDVAYVSKPCRPRDLVEVIDRLVNGGCLR